MMSKKELLFELAKTIIFEEGGDGAVIIVSSRYEELARDFLEYEKKLEKPIYTKRIYNMDSTIITFMSNEEFSQEGITFALDVGVRSIEFYDSVIFVHDIFQAI
jgi:hypothetical protein